MIFLHHFQDGPLELKGDLAEFASDGTAVISVYG